MAKVYRIDSVNGPYYVATKKQADRFWAEQPESIGPVDATDAEFDEWRNNFWIAFANQKRLDDV